MGLKPVAMVLVLGCGLCVIHLPASGATRKKRADKTDVAAPSVETVLRAEVAGHVDRRGQLAETLKQQPDSAPAARWQAGFIREGTQWRSFDASITSSTAAELLAVYHRRRATAPNTADGRVALANWCRDHALPDQEQAHLYAALANSPDTATPAILERLGYRQFAGQWLSPDQCREWRRMNHQAAESIAKWEKSIRRAADQLSTSRSRRDAALMRLRQINEPSAVPALEYLLAGQSEESALVAVETLRHIDGYEASQALAKQGVFSEWLDIRRAAATALKNRKLEDFIPELISLLSTPVRAELKVYEPGLHRGINAYPGALFYSLILARETIDQFQISTLTTMNLMADDYLAPNSIIGSVDVRSRLNPADPQFVPIDDPKARSALQRGRTDAERMMRDQLRAGQQSVEEFNDRVVELNSRISSVLSTVSSQPPSADLQTWWSWWSQFTDTQRAGEKQIVTVTDYESLGDPTPKNLGYGIIAYSCFAAGTTVWTELGPVAIEAITVGDRVLSQDVETGELAYNPVLQTSVRPPKDLTTLRLGDETIVCTGGHQFWSSGSGWVKARDLESQTLIHTVTGNTPVWTVKKGETAETYNLVVARFHTYFVGKAGILCQDLLPPQRTNNVVPGLSRAKAVAPAKK